MPRAKLTLGFELIIEVQQREGYFAARTNPFALTAYGKTEDEAEQRALGAVYFLLKQYPKTPKDLTEYFNKRHVKHTASLEVEGALKRRHVITRECKREMKVEVPVGA